MIKLPFYKFSCGELPIRNDESNPAETNGCKTRSRGGRLPPEWAAVKTSIAAGGVIIDIFDFITRTHLKNVFWPNIFVGA
jgi:hypothetical protein